MSILILRGDTIDELVREVICYMKEDPSRLHKDSIGKIESSSDGSSYYVVIEIHL